MKILLKNTLVLIALSIVFSNLTACTKTSNVNSQNGAVVGVTPDAANAAKTSNTTATPATETADGSYPPAPEAFMQTENKDLDGKVLKIEDYKGKVVLVNLWATWCGPCRAEMPTFIQLQEKYKDNDFVVIGLDADGDETVEEVNNFAKEMKLNYKLGFADGKMMSAFIKLTKLQGIPQTILINREGRMTGIFSGGGPKVLGQLKEAVDKTVSGS